MKYHGSYGPLAVFDACTYDRKGGPTLSRTVPMPWLASGWRSAYAQVPPVPADVKVPGGRSNLKGLFTLWDVEAWADTLAEVTTDPDPLLLSHVSGDLYAVEGAWELTEIERAVAAGRHLDARDEEGGA